MDVVANRMPSVRFSVAAWSAWAPGLVDADAWRRWADAPSVPAGDARPDLQQYPMMLRRRAERLARMALHTTAEVRCDAACPMVYASHRGETQRAVHLLSELATHGSVAPGPFSLSVHNAVSALESIAHGDTGNYTALAAGSECAEAALIEAAGLLADGASQVIVTVYDETLPDCYRDYAEEPDAAFSWSWRVAAAGDGTGFELSWEALETGHGTRGMGHGQIMGSPDRDHPALPVPRAPFPVPPSSPVSPPLPPALRILQFFLSDAETLSHDGSHCRWTWRRVA